MMNKLLRVAGSLVGPRMRVMLALGILLGLDASSALSAAEPVVVKLWNWDLQAKKFQQKMYKLFSERNPDIKIEYSLIPNVSYDQTLEASFAAKDPPDLFFPFNPMPNWHPVYPSKNMLALEAMVKQGRLKPLNEVAPDAKALKDWMARFQPVLRKFVEGERVFNGKAYTVDPWGEIAQEGVIALFYNKAQFSSAGVAKAPATYSELRRTAAKVTQAGQGKYYGIVHSLKGGWGWSFKTSLAWSGGAQLFDMRDGRFHCSTPESVAALNVWIGMRADGSVLPGEETLEVTKSTEVFPSGQAAMLLSGPWMPGSIRGANPDLDYDYVLPPTPDDGFRKGYLTREIDTGMGFGYVVSSSTKHPDAVWKVIEFICSLEYQKEYVKAGCGISYLAEANKPENLPDPHVYHFIEWVNDPALRRILPYWSPGAARVLDEFLEEPSLDEVLTIIYLGRAGLDALKDFDNRADAALDAAIKKAQEAGVKVTRQDFSFPDWDPSKDYAPKKQ